MEVIFRNVRFDRTEHLRGVTEIVAIKQEVSGGRVRTDLRFKMQGRLEICARSNCEIISIKEEPAHE